MSSGNDSTTNESESNTKEKGGNSSGGRRHGMRGSAHGTGAANGPSNRTPTAVVTRTKFEGKCDKLKGHIFDCSDSRQADQFTKTTKEIAEYVGSTYRHGGDARRMIETLEKPILRLPPDPPDDAPRSAVRLWEKRVDEVAKREAFLEENLKTIFSIVWGQCTDIMRQKLEALEEFAEMSNSLDGIALLKAIKDQSFNFQSQKKLHHALHESTRRFYLLQQGRHVTVQHYLEQFQNAVDVLEHSGGPPGYMIGIESALAEERNKEPDDLTRDDKVEAQQQYLAVAFVLGRVRQIPLWPTHRES
jgi:hypothetical protein